LAESLCKPAGNRSIIPFRVRVDEAARRLLGLVEMFTDALSTLGVLNDTASASLLPWAVHLVMFLVHDSPPLSRYWLRVQDADVERLLKVSLMNGTCYGNAPLPT
jgi:hypothetical protein